MLGAAVEVPLVVYRVFTVVFVVLAVVQVVVVVGEQDKETGDRKTS